MARPINRLVSYVPSRLCCTKVSPFLGIRGINTTPVFPSSVLRRKYLPGAKIQNFRGYARVVPAPETKGISQTEYDLRRTLLMESVPDGSICILVGASMKYSSDSVFYPFHQDPNFFYLTGFVERNALAVIRKDSSTSKGYTYHLFVLPTDPEKEKWDGLPIGIEGAIKSYNADEALANTRISSDLPPLLTSASDIYVSFPTTSGAIADEIRPRSRFLGHVSRYLPFLTLDGRYKPLAPKLHQLRSIKSSGEIACMREAGRISGGAFNEVIRRGFQKEKDIEATLEWLFRMGGCEKSAYVPVVAGGSNALTIHYTKNTQDINPDEMVLVDAGGVYAGYVADITRTWPLSRKFTDPQRDLYQAVLNVQKECVKMCIEEGNRTLDHIHQESVDHLTRELRNLGFDLGYRDVERTLYAHHISHHVGLEVHDCSTLQRGLTLKKGNCVTIEPGVYVPNDEKWPKHFRGIGVRIEDDVVVGDKKGTQIVLSADAVKEIVDIEALRD